MIFAKFGVKGLFSFGNVDYFGLLAVLLITFLVGIISGILPARKASQLSPADVLRCE